MEEKKKVVWTLSVLFLVVILGIGSKNIYDSRNKEKEKKEKKIIENKDMKQHNNQRIIMVDGKLYYDTGKTSTIEYRCGTMDGKITSNIDVNQIPYLNHQANFEGDYGYQFGLENTIEVMIDGKWIVFESK